MICCRKCVLDAINASQSQARGVSSKKATRSTCGLRRMHRKELSLVSLGLQLTLVESSFLPGLTTKGVPDVQ